MTKALPESFFKIKKDQTESSNLYIPYYKYAVRILKAEEKITLDALKGEEFVIKQYAKKKIKDVVSQKDLNRIERSLDRIQLPFLKSQLQKFVKTAVVRGVKQGASKLKQVGVTAPKIVPVSQTITNLTNVNVSLIKNLSQNQLSKIRVLVAETLDAKKTVEQLAQDIRKITKTNIRRARNIAHNEVRRAINNGRARVYIASGITHWMWQASFETNTCDFCQGLHGKAVKIGHSFGKSPFTKRDVIKPPDPHPYCKCSLVPVPVSYVQKKSKGKVVVVPVVQKQ